MFQNIKNILKNKSFKKRSIKPKSLLIGLFLLVFSIVSASYLIQTVNNNPTIQQAKAAGEPGVVTGITAATNAVGNDILSWNAPTDVGASPITDYEIRFTEGNTFIEPGTVLDDGVFTASEFDTDGVTTNIEYDLSKSRQLTPGLAYTFKVLAKNSNGLSDIATTTASNTLASYDCDIDNGGADLIISANTTLTAADARQCNIGNFTVDVNVTVTLPQLRTFKIQAVNADIKSGAVINGTAAGYCSATGPGAAGRNGAYGGFGRQAEGIGRVYGSITNPTDMGTGGLFSSFGSPFACAGGAIKLTASQGLINNGSILADGVTGGGFGGSGGSIWLSSQNFSGLGNISTKGHIDGGGGGRIAIYYETSTAVQNISASGGNVAGAGTIYIKEADKQYPSIIISNDVANQTSNLLSADPTPVPLSNIQDLILNNSVVNFTSGGQLQIEGNIDICTQICFGQTQLSLPSAIKAGDVTLGDKGLLRLGGTDVSTMNILNMSSGSVLTHQANFAVRAHVINLSVTDLNLDTGAIITADGLGYDISFGPGRNKLGNGAPQASYGGYGTGTEGTDVIYGNPNYPTDLGSGGFGNFVNDSGGGAIELNVSEVANVNGSVTANGGSAASGGSIYISANELNGTGSITAIGGVAQSNGTTKGGGGRIAVCRKKGSFPLATNINADNGTVVTPPPADCIGMSLEKKGVNTTSGSLTSARVGHTIKYVIEFSNTNTSGVPIPSVRINDILPNKVDFIPGTVQTPTNWTTTFSTDEGATYSATESVAATNINFLGLQIPPSGGSLGQINTKNGNTGLSFTAVPASSYCDGATRTIAWNDLKMLTDTVDLSGVEVRFYDKTDTLFKTDTTSIFTTGELNLDDIPYGTNVTYDTFTGLDTTQIRAEVILTGQTWGRNYLFQLNSTGDNPQICFDTTVVD